MVPIELLFLVKKQTIQRNINKKQINKAKRNMETKITTSQKKKNVKRKKPEQRQTNYD